MKPAKIITIIILVVLILATIYLVALQPNTPSRTVGGQPTEEQWLANHVLLVAENLSIIIKLLSVFVIMVGIYMVWKVATKK